MCVLLLQLAYWLPFHVKRTDGIAQNLDFPIYYEAARNFAQDRRLYGAERGVVLSFLYPPTFLAVVSPLSALGRNGFQATFYILNLVAFWACAIALGKIAGRRARDALWVGMVILPIAAWPMSMGNVELAVWAIVMWAFAAPHYAAALLVAGAAIKLYPAIPLVVLVIREPRKYVRQTLVAAAVVAGATMPLTGFAPWREFLTDGLRVIGAGSLHRRNISLPVAILRPFVPELPTWFGLYAALTAVAIVGSAAWFSRRQPPALQASIVLLAGVLAAPLCWSHQLGLALVPAAIWLRSRTPRADGIRDRVPSYGADAATPESPAVSRESSRG